jgi:hypothetical protein
MTDFAIALFRGSIGRLFHMDTRESDSLMNFSSMGSLRCICGEQHPAGVAADRREVCRQCGCAVVATNSTMVDQQLSKREIKAMTSSLRRIASRVSHLELPPTVTSISELHKYLESSAPRTLRTESSQAVQVEQPQIH